MRHTLSISTTLIYINISLTFEYTWRKKNTRECKNSKMYIRKCEIQKCISLQNVLQDIFQGKIYSL